MHGFLFLGAEHQLQLRAQAWRVQPEDVLPVAAGVHRQAGHLGVQQPRRELRRLVRVGGEAVRAHDPPDAFLAGQFHDGPAAGGEPQTPGRRIVEAEHPLVAQVPGVPVEVVPREGGNHENPVAEAEVAVSRRRGFLPEPGAERFAFRRLRSRSHPDREVRRGQSEVGEVRLGNVLDLAFKAQRGDVLQQQIRSALRRGRTGAAAFGNRETLAVPVKAHSGPSRTFDLHLQDVGLVEPEDRIALVAFTRFPLEQRDPARDGQRGAQREERRSPHAPVIAATGGRQFWPPAAAMPAPRPALPTSPA